MDSDGRQLIIKQPSRRVVVKLQRRLANKEVCDDITIDLTNLDALGNDNLIQIVDPSQDRIEMNIDLDSGNSGDMVKIVPAQTNRALVKEAIAGLVAMAFLIYFLVTGLPSAILPIIGVILGYYFGSRNTRLRN